MWYNNIRLENLTKREGENMTNLLIKLFIKDKNTEKSETRAKYGMLSSVTGIIVNILLIVFQGKKILIWLEQGVLN